MLSGGFAGVVQQVTVDSLGQLESSDKRRKLSGSSTLSAEEMQIISQQLTTVPNAGTEIKKTPFGQSCNDCFQYSFDAVRENARFSSTFNSLHLDKIAYAPLVRTLIGMMHKSLAAN